MQLYTDIYLLLNYSTCIGRPSRPSSRVRKTVVAGSGTDHTIPDSMICTNRLQLEFLYSWWWARWTPETCRV